MTSDDTTTITLAGIDVPVVRKGRGRPLVMLHGGGGPVAAFPFADRLAEHFEVIAPVHPGFGGTPIPEHFDDIHDLVYLHLDLLDALAVEDAVLMGFSMGGWTAAEIAVRSTARIGKLILVDAVGIRPGGREDRDIADIFALAPQDLARITWHDPAKAPDMSKMSDAELEIFAGNRIALGLYTWQPYMHNPKLRYRLHRIDVPTLLIWGESDGIVTPDYGAAYRDLIPGARLVVVPEAGHAPQAEQPGAFVDHVLSFAG